MFGFLADANKGFNFLLYSRVQDSKMPQDRLFFRFFLFFIFFQYSLHLTNKEGRRIIQI